MQIHLDQTVERVDTGYGITTIHKFTDKNLERVNTFANHYMMSFTSESTVRLYFDLFKGYNATMTYDFNNDVFYCDVCDRNGVVKVKINHIDSIVKVIDAIEKQYINEFTETRQ